MLRTMLLWGMLLLLPGAVAQAAGKFPETTDPEVARKDPDFLVQGEYLGRGQLPGGGDEKVGAQVIARGSGEFEVVIYQGGLPGQGWKRGDNRLQMTGKSAGGAVKLAGAKADSKLSGTLADDKLTITDAEGKTKVVLSRIERASPSLGQKPPAGAKVLFDGKVNEFPGATLLPDGNLKSEATSVPLPADFRMHLEFRLSWMPTARGQARSNSGVYLHNCYETQVLDSFGLEGLDNECGGFYKVRQPAVNMCFPPLVWQTYDITFTAPKYDAAGKKTANARVSVVHNGVAIHENVELPADTPGRQKEGPAPRPVYFQGHGNNVEYRNVWLVPGK